MKTNFKKIVPFLLGAILLFSFSITVFAESLKTYDIPDLNLSISVPKSMVVYTREICENEQLLDSKGISYSTLISQFKTNSIYFNALDSANNQEIVITMSSGSLNDFNLLGDTALDALVDTLVSQYDGYSIVAQKHDIYQHSQAKFIRVFFYDKTNSVYGLQYYTTYNSKAINITLRSYSGTINSTKEALIKSVIDSVKFSTEPQKSTVSESGAFKYSDTDSGVSFTVPNNWIQKELSQNRQYLDAKFVSTTDAGASILYGSTDMWAQMSSSEKSGYTRNDINTFYFTKQDVAEMMGCSLSSVSDVSYNGEKYYQVITSQNNVSGTGLSVTMTMMLHIEDGWMYRFQFSGKPNQALFADFESLLKTVSYQQLSVPVPSSDSSKSQTNHSQSGTKGIVIGVLVLVLAAVIVLTIVAYQKKQKNTSNQVSSAEISSNSEENVNSVLEKDQTISTMTSKIQESSLESNSATTKSIGIYCHKCGHRLPDDSDFCYRCGAKQIKEDNKFETK